MIVCLGAGHCLGERGAPLVSHAEVCLPVLFSPLCFFLSELMNIRLHRRLEQVHCLEAVANVPKREISSPHVLCLFFDRIGACFHGL
jgi:hypothetical protein